VIIVRFKVLCQPERSDEMAKLMGAVAGVARPLEGVIHFDIARDVTNSDAIVATEVFADRDAMEKEEQLPEVAEVVRLLGEDGVLADRPEWTIYEVSRAETPSLDG
jgi:quinol monooxygenase YgiN